MELTRDQISLLLFFETVEVDGGGTIDTRRMNETDFENAKAWKESGFIEFGRIAFKAIKQNNTHWVRLSAEAITEAHRQRRERIMRLRAQAKTDSWCGFEDGDGDENES